jgi:hypothetical protein
MGIVAVINSPKYYKLHTFGFYFYKLLISCTNKMDMSTNMANVAFTSNTKHWHDKGFTLQWDYPEVKFVLVNFRNGQKKRWYKRTERAYRFKRWFLRKGKDSFSNIANYNAQFITLYLFSWYISFPKKVIVPMNVGALKVHEPESLFAMPVANVKDLNADMVPPTSQIIHPKPPTFTNGIRLKNEGLVFSHSIENRLSESFNNYNEVNYPILEKNII